MFFVTDVSVNILLCFFLTHFVRLFCLMFSLYNIGGDFMKRFFLTILLAIILFAPLGAKEGTGWRFIFADLDQHPEILVGFCPSYVMLGAGYDFNPSSSSSELQVLVGGGYMQRRLWQDPVDGSTIHPSVKSEVNDEAVTYDFAEVDFQLRFVQGFFDDMLTLQAGANLRYETNMDNLFVGKNSSYGMFHTLDYYLGKNYSGAVYPDLAGNHQFLGTSFDLEFQFNMMDDNIVYNQGVTVNLFASYAPRALNSALDGFADYYTLQLNAVGAVTLYELKSAGQTWLSIVLIDRFNVSWTDGSAVPVYAQESVSLGRRVRGYSKFSYNTQLTMVNNLDIRFAGPGLGLNWLRPRINVFFDIGYGAGSYFNTQKGASCEYTNGNFNLLMSTGAQFTITVADMIDLGYEIAYIIGNGSKLQDPGNRFVGAFTFFLDF